MVTCGVIQMIIKKSIMICIRTLHLKFNISRLQNVRYLTSASATGEMKQRFLVVERNIASIFHSKTKDIIKNSDVLLMFEPISINLTEKLLDETNNKIILFNPTSEVKSLIDTEHTDKIKNDNKVVISKLNFFKFYSYMHQSNNNSHSKLINLINKHAPENANIKIIGSLRGDSFLRHILCCYSLKISLFETHNPTMLFFVNHKIYSSLFKMSIKKKCQRLGIVYQACHNIKHLATIPKCYFSKKYTKSIANFSKDYESINNWYLIQLSPKMNICTEDNTVAVRNDEIGNFIFFINYMIRLPLNRPLVFSLEDFVPGIGKDLIKKGFKVWENSHNLTNDQWIIAFNYFISHPKYKDSIYVNMFEDYKVNFGTEMSLPLAESEDYNA